MSKKRKRKESKPAVAIGSSSGWEPVNASKVNEAVALLVDFAEEQKLHPKIIVVAMEFIIKKIKDHLQLETREVTADDDGTRH